MLYCDVPESSGLDVSHLSSPIVTLAHYEGLTTDDEAPAWCRIEPAAVFEFKQPQAGMAELFVELASLTENRASVRVQ